MPKISVIVPVYNVEKYLKRCIESIVNQTFTDFELILVDDGSLDKSGDICDEYADKDARIKVVHQENKGTGAARNVGIDLALDESDWICFVDGDDWLHLQFLEIMLALLYDTGCKVAACPYDKVSTPFYESAFYKEMIGFHRIESEDFFVNNKALTSSSCAKIFHSTVFESIRFPNEIYGEDAFIVFRILFKYSHVAYVELPLYYYFQNENSIMHTKWNPRKAFALKAFNEQVNFFKDSQYSQAYQKSLEAYAHSLYENIIESQKVPNYKNETSQMKKELKRFLRENKKNQAFSVHKVAMYYEVLYPFEMLFYWKLNKIKSLLQR